ncbi:MAG: GIY-YIG nuclease family protein [Alistipes sp.]|nr:GIY-YIG nuclease family protein [Alistipes sp.]
MRKVKAIEAENKKKILAVCPDCPDRSGIYFLLREENGFRFGYIGQAKRLLTRLASHLRGFQHIDLSLKKHGLYSADNPHGYRVHYLEFPISELDAMERHYERKYANAGYQLRNKTSGGQGEGKTGIAANKSSKGYYDGLERGKEKTQQWVADLFTRHLKVVPKNDPPTKNQLKALQRFTDFITPDTEGEQEDQG